MASKSPQPPFSKGGQENPPLRKGDLGRFPDATRCCSKSLVSIQNDFQRVLVIGIGNEFRSDDAAGRAVARKLANRDLVGATVLQLDGDAPSLLDAWKGWQSVIVVDAVQSGDQPGVIHRIEADQLGDLDSLTGVSSHGLGLREAVRLAEAIGQLPPGLTIYGIEGKAFHYGYGLSPEVTKAVSQVSNCILEEIQCTSTASPGI